MNSDTALSSPIAVAMLGSSVVAGVGLELGIARAHGEGWVLLPLGLFAAVCALGSWLQLRATQSSAPRWLARAVGIRQLAGDPAPAVIREFVGNRLAAHSVTNVGIDVVVLRKPTRVVDASVADVPGGHAIVLTRPCLSLWLQNRAAFCALVDHEVAHVLAGDARTYRWFRILILAPLVLLPFRLVLAVLWPAEYGALLSRLAPGLLRYEAVGEFTTIGVSQSSAVHQHVEQVPGIEIASSLPLSWWLVLLVVALTSGLLLAQVYASFRAYLRTRELLADAFALKAAPDRRIAFEALDSLIQDNHGDPGRSAGLWHPPVAVRRKALANSRDGSVPNTAAAGLTLALIALAVCRLLVLDHDAGRPWPTLGAILPWIFVFSVLLIWPFHTSLVREVGERGSPIRHIRWYGVRRSVRSSALAGVICALILAPRWIPDLLFWIWNQNSTIAPVVATQIIDSLICAGSLAAMGLMSTAAVIGATVTLRRAPVAIHLLASGASLTLATLVVSAGVVVGVVGPYKEAAFDEYQTRQDALMIDRTGLPRSVVGNAAHLEAPNSGEALALHMCQVAERRAIANALQDQLFWPPLFWVHLDERFLRVQNYVTSDDPLGRLAECTEGFFQAATHRE